MRKVFILLQTHDLFNTGRSGKTMEIKIALGPNQSYWEMAMAENRNIYLLFIFLWQMQLEFGLVRRIHIWLHIILDRKASNNKLCLTKANMKKNKSFQTRDSIFVLGIMSNKINLFFIQSPGTLSNQLQIKFGLH